MKILVTGSAGHLGEALVRRLRERAFDVVGIDVQASPFTDRVGSITDRAFVRETMRGIEAVLHPATLHKPHVATNSRQDFVDVNITGTLNLLEESAAAGVGAFVFTSTTSAFGDALRPPPGEPAAWITEAVAPVAKNIYGATKTAAEDLCRLFARNQGLPCVVLRTSRFFPEDDDEPSRRKAFDRDNLQVCELLYRRVDLADVVEAHLLAIERAPELGFDRFIISATTPFDASDLERLRRDPAGALDRHVSGWRDAFSARGWRMLDEIERVYDNARARQRLGWQPRVDFAHALNDLVAGRDYRSALARSVGAKGYRAKPPTDEAEAREMRKAEIQAVHPVLMSRDVARSIEFFGRLGFRLAFRDADRAPRYAGIIRDGVELHLQWHDAAEWAVPVDRPTYRFPVPSVDALHAEFRSAGVEDMTAASDTPWGTREFHLRDPDGNGLQFYRDR